MTNQTLPNFKTVSSIPASEKLFIQELFLSVMFSFVLNLIVIVIYDVYILEDSEIKASSLLSNLTIKKGIIYFLMGVIFRYIILTVYYMIYPKTTVSFRIDELGLHEIKTNRKQTKTESILYKDITNSLENGFGLYIDLAVDHEDTSLLRCYFVNENQKEEYKIIPFFLFCKNKVELVKTFLLGVTTYRPDIVIDPNVFGYFLIDDTTFEYDRKTAKDINSFVNRFLLIFFLISLSLVVIILYFIS
jgi:hypothetical protein